MKSKLLLLLLFTIHLGAFDPLHPALFPPLCTKSSGLLLYNSFPAGSLMIKNSSKNLQRIPAKKTADKTNPSKSFSPACLMVPVGLPGFLTEERQQNLQIISQIITQHFLLTIDEDLQLSPGQTPQNRNSHSQGYSELSGGLGTVKKDPAIFCWKIQGVQLR